jgi:putative ABC transport system permease protein
VTAVPVIRAASAGASRRLVQTVVVFVVLTAATAAALLGLTLTTNANELFQNAFVKQRGADLALTINMARVTSGELAATRHLPGETKAAGPYPAALVTISAPSPAGPAHAGTSGHGSPPAVQIPVTVVGRASRFAPLDVISQNQGQWAARAGEIDAAIYIPVHAPLGSKVTVLSAPGKPRLTLVGYAGSVVRDEGAWVSPGEIAALRAKGAPAQVQMLYTFTSAGTAAQVSSDYAELKHVLTAGAITSSTSWLGSADQTGPESSVNTPFVVAFALIGLALAVLITASVVSGAVVASYRRIGVLKSVGFTPAQVAATYLAQFGLPAVAGCLAGTVLGNWWVVPELNDSASAFHIARQAVPVWIIVTTPLGMCALVGLAALVPALRAGRLPAVAAITAGQAPRAGHGYTAHRLAGQLALPRPVTIGLAAPFSRPARSAATLAAITFGLTAVVLSVGLDTSLAKVNGSAGQGQGQVQIDPAGQRFAAGQQAFTATQARAAAAALRVQPGTRRYLGEGSLLPGGNPFGNPTPGAVTVARLGQTPVTATAYNGPSGWTGWDMVSGHWYRGTGQVDVDSTFLTLSGLHVGDTFQMTVHGRPVTARIAGDVYDPGAQTPQLFTNWQTLGGAAAGLAVAQYDVGLKPGTSAQAYAAALGKTLGPGYSVSTPRTGAPLYSLIDTSYIRLLTLMMAALAGLGVLNSVLMATRERVHDLGIFKAVGMTPRQTIAMVTCWAAVPAIGAAVIALPAGMIAQDEVMRHLTGHGSLALPGSYIHTYTAAGLAALALAGLAIAAVGALLPAAWAAASRTTTALRAE